MLSRAVSLDDFCERSPGYCSSPIRQNAVGDIEFLTGGASVLGPGSSGTGLPTGDFTYNGTTIETR